MPPFGLLHVQSATASRCSHCLSEPFTPSAGSEGISSVWKMYKNQVFLSSKSGKVKE